MKRRMILLMSTAVVVVLGGGYALSRGLEDDRSPAVRGKELAYRLGCFACHGPEGSGGVADPRAPGGEVPDWRYETMKLFADSEADIRMWITHGFSRGEMDRERAGRHTSIAPMPPYRSLLSDREVDDLLAYVLAVAGWRDAYTEDQFQGRNLALRFGCFGCHGPSGIGGVPDPGSATGFVPALVGHEFDELVHDDDELREWILEGTIPRLQSASRPMGKARMPAYHDFLSDSDLEKLALYLRSLRTEGKQTTTANEADEVIG